MPELTQQLSYESNPESRSASSLVHHRPLKYHRRLLQVVGADVVVVGAGVEDVGECVDGAGEIVGLGVGPVGKMKEH